ncbi:MAG TPA: flagellar hook-length control protein FliK [Sphingopyxis sp.]|uniref:flagellar hook-length control protein FliK n=1 Tax=Sphingopyxis sp. TaxID=1908224 RepID=UPI002C28CC18|nr:flagellar hook-length control protein FliK [Sphingopyxis sp.]HWW55672.1 flagellar hook-length control protein FliK [Sphingopyxis sp.]
MMGAPSLPSAQGAMPAGFATFLSNIGQLPGGGSEGGFGQLLATAPVTGAPIPNAAATVETDTALPAEAGTPQIDSPPTEAGVTLDVPVAKLASGEADVTTLAANLLIALNGGVPGNMPAPGKPVPAEAEADTAPEVATTGEAASTAAATNWAGVVAAVIPAGAKPAKPAEALAVPADTDAPATPVTAHARNNATPLPMLAGTEPQAAKADAAPSMTVLFTQPASQAATTLATAAPVQVAERVLDMGSDTLWIDQLARDITAAKSEDGDISFRLMPRHLGRLDVAMKMGDEGMSLKMDTRHEATATIVTAAQAKLVDELRQQGVRVAGTEVTCTPGETGRQSQGQNYQGQGRAGAPDPAHLIETATERAEPRDEDRAADRRGRFA